MNNMNAMDYVGIASLFEKKECIIDGKKQIYYQKIGPCIGFLCDFIEGKKFAVLSGKLAGKTINSNSNYDYATFKTMNELAKNNNNTYDYNKFMNLEKYQNGIGEYYTYDYDADDKCFYFNRITDQKLLQKIRGTIKDYDDTVLNSDTDISKMYSTIKKTIISQDEQIMQILTSLFKNQKVINSSLNTDIIAKLKEIVKSL